MFTVQQAAQRYLDLRDRRAHPDGTTDNGGRWYPSSTEDPNGTIVRTIRSPSRAFPWSYAHACRTAAHVAELYGVDVTELRREARKIDKAAKTPITL